MMTTPAAPPPGGRGPGAADKGDRDLSLHACLKRAARSARPALSWKHESDLVFSNMHLAATSALSERMALGTAGPLAAAAGRLWAEAQQLLSVLDSHLDFAAMAAEQRAYTRGRVEAVAGGGGSLPHPEPCAGGADQTDLWAAASGHGRAQGVVSGITPLFMDSLQAGWPLDAALTLWAGLGPGTFSADGRVFLVAGASLAGAEVVSLGGQGEQGLGRVCLALDGSRGRILGVAASAGSLLPPSASGQASRKRSRWAPVYVRLPLVNGRRTLDGVAQDVLAVVLNAAAWRLRLGDLPADTEAIISGRFVYPKVAMPSEPVDMRNHASFELDPAAQEALGPIVAVYIWRGIIEVYREGDPWPLMIMPLGAVPKSSPPFYRLITDARPQNVFLADWPVVYNAIREVCESAGPCAVLFSFDLSDAYHQAGPLQGCEPGKLIPYQRVGPGGQSFPAWALGCLPSTCRGRCDKAMSAFRIGNMVGRFAAAQFGQKTAGGPLNALLRPVKRHFAIRVTPIAMHIWVDDTCFVILVRSHPPCHGEVGGFQTCTSALRRPARTRLMRASCSLTSTWNCPSPSAPARHRKSTFWVCISIP